MFKARILFFLFVFSALAVSAQEICNNAIDDDMDGLIDLNDDDCECIIEITSQPSSLIPNPSFEDFSCIPYTFSQLDCADTWIQASGATSDFLHMDGFTGSGYGFVLPEVPLPPPDGDGFVGFALQNNYGVPYAEYVGACLLDVMSADTVYTLQFFVGFGTPGVNPYGYYGSDLISPPDFEICIFGNPDCNELPFYGYGCPQSNGWEPLICETVSGNDEWVATELTFTPDIDINTIIIGPGCSFDTNGDTYYMYLDGLNLSDSVSFAAPQIDLIGDCGDFTLTAPELEDFDIQWYQDGIAIVGSTDTIYQPGQTNGTYSVVYDNGSECGFSNEVDFVYQSAVSLDWSGDTVICPGDFTTLTAIGTFDEIYWNGNLGNENFTTDETGTVSLEVVSGNCSTDTIINITSAGAALIDALDGDFSFCPGNETTIEISGTFDEIYWNGDLGGSSFTIDEAGPLEIEIVNGNCSADTLIQINEELPASINAIDGNEVFCDGESITLELDGDYDSIEWNGQPGGSTFETDEAGPLEISLTLGNCSLDTIIQIQDASAAAINSISGPFGFCPGESTDITINGSFNTISWNGVEGNNTETFDSSETVLVEVETNQGCEVDTTFEVVEFEPVEVIINNAPQITIDEGTSFAVDLSGTNIDFVYEWTPAGGLSCADCPNPQVNGIQNVTYVLTTTNSVTGCSDIDSLQVIVIPAEPVELCEIYFPNIFTPDENGLNDSFYPIAKEGCILNMLRFSVYNRWGELVFNNESFSSNDSREGWDGTYKLNQLDPGVFVWVAEFENTDGSIERTKGNITLLR